MNKYDQEVINGFIEEMHFQGFHCFQCPNCEGALWFEGSPLMLMRYATIHQDDCEVCSEEIKKVAEV
tara:strand:+ start:308 stop:508 length:201 start_codon:yes stop_codon:yes gene_type:complete